MPPSSKAYSICNGSIFRQMEQRCIAPLQTHPFLNKHEQTRGQCETKNHPIVVLDRSQFKQSSNQAY